MHTVLKRKTRYKFGQKSTPKTKDLKTDKVCKVMLFSM